MRSSVRMNVIALFAAVALALPLAQAATSSPLITHDAVKQALKGQALTLKAKVTGGAGIQAVTLYYTLSRDAAPFKVSMKAAGLDYYLGTIEGAVLAGAPSLSYYIEAEDTAGAVRETPWQVIALRDPKPGETNTPGAPSPLGTPRVPVPGAAEDDGISMGLIAGGAAAVIGGALLVANNDSGGGGGDSGTTDPGAAAGVYSGTATTCLTLSGTPPTCESHAITITIDSQGKVLSTNLREGQSLTDTLSGPNFNLVAGIDGGTNGVTGEIFYHGTVVGKEIVGSISGSQQGGTAGSGSYSGSFSATRP